MFLQGKDRWETRVKRRQWWHANRDWLSLLGWLGGIALVLVLILRLA